MLTAAGLHHRHLGPRCPQSDSASRRWRCPGDQHPELLPASPCGGPGTNQNRSRLADLPGDPFTHTERGDSNGRQPARPRLPDGEKVEPGTERGLARGRKGEQEASARAKGECATPPQRGMVRMLSQRCPPRKPPTEGAVLWLLWLEGSAQQGSESTDSNQRRPQRLHRAALGSTPPALSCGQTPEPVSYQAFLLVARPARRQVRPRSPAPHPRCFHPATKRPAPGHERGHDPRTVWLNWPAEEHIRE